MVVVGAKSVDVDNTMFTFTTDHTGRSVDIIPDSKSIKAALYFSTDPKRKPDKEQHYICPMRGFRLQITD
jgi:hypothetical protein